MKKVDASSLLLDFVKSANDVLPAMKFGCWQGSFIRLWIINYRSDFLHKVSGPFSNSRRLEKALQIFVSFDRDAFAYSLCHCLQATAHHGTKILLYGFFTQE